MKDSVVIKSNAYGLILYLDPQLPFERLREDVERKFARSARFFRGAQMALTFRGRELTEDEELSLWMPSRRERGSRLYVSLMKTGIMRNMTVRL